MSVIKRAYHPSLFSGSLRNKNSFLGNERRAEGRGTSGWLFAKIFKYKKHAWGRSADTHSCDLVFYHQICRDQLLSMYICKYCSYICSTNAQRDQKWIPKVLIWSYSVKLYYIFLYKNLYVGWRNMFSYLFEK